MAIPLSMIGISMDDKKMLSERLFPEANKILIEQLAKDYGYKPSEIEKIDYSNHPIYKMNKSMAKRKQQFEYLKGKDLSEFDYPFESFKQACEKEPGKHFILKQNKEPLEKLNEKIEELKLDIPSDEEKDSAQGDDDTLFIVSPITLGDKAHAEVLKFI